jgi:hypothetical protein
MKNNKIHAEDLWLLEAGAFSFFKTIWLHALLILQPATRKQYQKIRHEARLFRKYNMPSLEAKLFPRQQVMSKTKPSYLNTGILAGGLCALGLFFIAVLPESSQSDYKMEYAAKGLGLGMSHYIKNQTIHIPEAYRFTMTPADTLQLIPVARKGLHTAIFSRSATSDDLQKIFPLDGQNMALVTEDALPPSLTLDSAEENLLLCITSLTDLSVDVLQESLEQALKHYPKHTVWLKDSILVQIYNVRGQND